MPTERAREIRRLRNAIFELGFDTLRAFAETKMKEEPGIWNYSILLQTIRRYYGLKKPREGSKSHRILQVLEAIHPYPPEEDPGKGRGRRP